MRPIQGVISPKDATTKANSEDPDQTAPLWVYTVCPDLCVPKLRIIMLSEVDVNIIFDQCTSDSAVMIVYHI